MQHRLPAVLLVCLSFLATAIQASNFDPAATLKAFPKCAQTCIIGAIGSGLCAPTNQTCICTNQDFQQTVTACVMQGCSIPDSLLTRNASLTNCGAPVRDRSDRLVNVTYTLVILAAVFVALRSVHKFAIARSRFDLDDWFVLATMLSAIPSAAITIYGTTPNGLGKDIWTLDPDQITNVIRFFYVMACLYFTQATLIKLAFICFFMRIFTVKQVQRLLWGTFIGISLWGLAFVLTAIFQCQPISYFWTKWDGSKQGGKCIDANAFTWTHAGMSIALDFWILLIPLLQLRKLHMHWKKKIPVAFMFLVGTFVTIVSILRLQSLLVFGASDNATWEFFDVSLWSTIEISVGIMCACLPAVRLLLVRVFPILSPSSYASKGGYYNHSSGPRSGFSASGAREAHEARIAANRRANMDSDGHESPTGIRLQKSFVVQFSDRDRDREGDETSLVQLSTLPPPTKTWQGDP